MVGERKLTVQYVQQMPSTEVQDVPGWNRSGYIPQLDGFRGIAVIFVLLGHALEFNQSSAKLTKIGSSLAQLGVFLFFVLSGFLITMLLYRERLETDEINIRRFYIRRLLRLGPALILFLLVVSTLIYVRLITDVPRYELLACIFYARNIFGRSQSLSHLWSLSLEEQFYLCWPMLFSILPIKRSLTIIVALTSLISLWRGLAIYWNLFDYNSGVYYVRPYFRFDSILIGGCLAIALASRPGFLSLAKSVSRQLPAGLGWALLLGWSLIGEVWSRPLYLTVQMILIVGLLGQLSIGESSWSQRIFRQSSVRYIGKISYSLYLWQQLFLVTKQPRWGILRQLPVSMLIPFALAVLSHRFFEGPILRIKDRVCSHGRLHHL